LFIKSQFITGAPNILHLNQCTHGHVWSRTVAPFQRSWRTCEWFDRHQNYAGEASLRFQLQLNKLGYLSAPTNKNLKDWYRANVNAITRKLRDFRYTLHMLHKPLYRNGCVTRTNSSGLSVLQAASCHNRCAVQTVLELLFFWTLTNPRNTVVLRLMDHGPQEPFYFSNL
jgi:hypothetical protein